MDAIQASFIPIVVLGTVCATAMICPWSIDRATQGVAEAGDEQRQSKLRAAQAEKATEDADSGPGHGRRDRASFTQGYHP